LDWLQLIKLACADALAPLLTYVQDIAFHEDLDVLGYRRSANRELRGYRVKRHWFGRKQVNNRTPCGVRDGLKYISSHCK
jgi:hypothetical protein